MAIEEKINQILLKLIKWGTYGILFLPLIMNSRFFFPFIVPRNVLFRVIVELMFAAYLIIASFNPEYRPKFNKVVNSALAFFGVTVIATLLGINIYASFWSNYERMGGLIHYLHLAMYFFVLFNTFKSKKDWHSFFSFSVFASVLMCFIAFAQWQGLPFILKSSGGTRLAATLGNAIYLAAYLLFNLFFAVFFSVKEKRFDLKIFSFSFFVFNGFLLISSIFSKLFEKYDWGAMEFFKSPILIEAIKYPGFIWPFIIFQVLIIGVWFYREKQYCVKALLVVIAIFQFIILLETGTRGVMIGIGVGLFIMSIVILFLPIKKWLKAGAASYLAISILAALFFFTSAGLIFGINVKAIDFHNMALNRLAGISLADITIQARLAAWNASWQGWTETPKSFLIGYGPENYYYVFNKYFPPVIFRDAGSQIWFDRAHNIIFELGVTTGLIGLAAYLTMLGLAIQALIKRYKKNRLISSSWLFIVLIIAYFIQDLSVFDMLNTDILFFLLLAYIAFVYQTELLTGREPEEEETKAVGLIRLNYISTAAVIILLLFGLSINYQIVKANTDLIKAITSQDLNEKLDYFKKSIYESPIGHFEARQQLGSLAVDLSRNGNIAPNTIKMVIDLAANELKKSINEEPLNIRERLLLAMAYDNFARYDSSAPAKAIGLLENYIYLSPTRPQVYIELGQAYLLQGNIDKAASYFQKSIDLAPWVIESRWTRLSFYVITKQFNLADQEFISMQKDLAWRPTADDYVHLIGIYGQVKDYPKMIECADKIVQLSPTADSYAQLAIIYAKAGNNQKAHEAVNLAIKINPAVAASAEAFLKQIDAGAYLDK